MPLLVFGFFMMQLDRGNIANALTDTILKDLGITTDDVNTRYQLLSLGILLFEIPSNIILQRVRPLRDRRLTVDRTKNLDYSALGVGCCLEDVCKGQIEFSVDRFSCRRPRVRLHSRVSLLHLNMVQA